MSNFPFDPNRAAALASHLGCDEEQIKVVEGEGEHVYTQVDDGQTQEDAEQENGRWLIFKGDDAFDEATVKLVRESLINYHADGLGAAIFGDGTTGYDQTPVYGDKG